MTDLFTPPDNAATPLTAQEMRGLIPSHIAYHRDLNEAEQDNIRRGQTWAMGRRRELVAILSEKFIKELHQRMLGDVWRWAGKFRESEKNIGINYWEIPVSLRQLLDDTKTWIEHNTYLPDEMAVRFHHRLVQIHPFPNGNGRHSRLMADLLIMKLGLERFSWGRQSLYDAGAVRRNYIEALRSADNHDIGPILLFARA